MRQEVLLLSECCDVSSCVFNTLYCVCVCVCLLDMVYVILCYSEHGICSLCSRIYVLYDVQCLGLLCASIWIAVCLCAMCCMCIVFIYMYKYVFCVFIQLHYFINMI